MAEDYKIQIGAELDTTQAEKDLKAFTQGKNKITVDVEPNADRFSSAFKRKIADLSKTLKESVKYLFFGKNIEHEVVSGFSFKPINTVKEDLKKLSDTTVRKLLLGKPLDENEFETVHHWMEECGYDASNLTQHLATLATAMNESTVAQIRDLTSLQDELAVTSEALAAYKEAAKGEKGGDIGAIEKIYKGALEDLDAGRYDTRRLHAAAELFFTPEQLAEMNYDMREVGQQLRSAMMTALFDPEGDSKYSAGQRLVQQIMENPDLFRGIANATKNSDGSVSFFYNSVKELADAFNLSEAAIGAFLDELDVYGVEIMRSTQENQELISQFQTIASTADSTTGAVAEFITALSKSGRDVFEISSILASLQDAGVIRLSTDEINQTIAETTAQLDMLDQENPEPSMGLDTSAATSAALSFQSLLNSIVSGSYTAYLSLVTDTGGAVSTAGTAGTGGTGTKKQVSKARAVGGTGSAGDTLVNELGPELISDRGVAYIANGGRPGFTWLSKDAVVFNADETEKIFRKGYVDIPFPSYAEGTRKGLIGKLLGGLGFPAKASGSSGWTCPYCGRSNPSTVSKCRGCGKDPRNYKPTTTTTTSTTTSTKTTSTSSSSSSNRWKCNHCGFANPQTAVKCQSCGKVRGTIPERVTDSSYQSAAPESTISLAGGSYWKCDNCGRTNSTSVNYCASCGKYRFSTKYTSVTPNANQTVTFPEDTAGSYIGGGGGGGGVGGSNYQSQADPEKIDWIAVKLNRLQRIVQDFQKIASSGFKKLSVRLETTQKEIASITEEISAAEAAYKRYAQEAESVGLSSDIAEKVKNGTIDISKYDQETVQKIREFQEWWEKSLDAKSSIETLTQTISQRFVDLFNAIQTEYENHLSVIEHGAKMVQQDISMVSAKGMLENAQFYQKMADYQTQSISEMKKELSELESSLASAVSSGKITEGTEAWFDMKEAISSVEESIAAANVQIEEYRKKIRQISWNSFDYAQDRFSQLSQEAAFLINLMSNDQLFEENGQFNQTGQATAGLHVLEYNAYMKQNDEYAKELRKIQMELASNPYDKELIVRKETLLSLQQQSVQAAEAEKNAIRNLVAQGIDLELASLQKLITAYNDSLTSAKDLYTYQKDISRQTSNIASLEKQLSAYQNDTSQESRAKLQKLQKELSEAKETLSETEYDKNIADQRALLDQVYSEYEELLNHRLDNVDALMSEMIDMANANLGEIRDEIQDASTKVGYAVTDALSSTLDGQFSNYENMFTGITAVNKTLDDIYAMVAAMARASGAVKAYASGGLIDYTGIAMVHGSPDRPEMVLNAKQTEIMRQMADRIPVAYDIREMRLPARTTESVANMIENKEITVNLGGIQIDHVQDYPDFLRQLQADPKFEKLIDTMTMGRMLGGSKFAKNAVRV